MWLWAQLVVRWKAVPGSPLVDEEGHEADVARVGQLVVVELGHGVLQRDEGVPGGWGAGQEGGVRSRVRE